MHQHKTCTQCGERKPVDSFGLHKARRDGRNTACKDCAKAASKRYAESNHEKVKASKRNWAARNPEMMAEYSRRHKESGRMKTATSLSMVRARNPESYARMHAKWAKRRADRCKATPAWYDAAKVNAIYAQAERMRSAGFDVHVDHILPLRGDSVSGLHVHNNLRIIPAKENLAKGAKMPIELA